MADQVVLTPPAGELGSSGLRRWDGYVDEEWHPKLRGRMAARVYREMADNEAVLGGALGAIDTLASQAVVRFDPADESDAAKAEATFVESCFDETETTEADRHSEVISELEYGWALLEEVYKLRTDGRWGWLDLAPRSQDSLERWVFDERGRANGMIQLDPVTGRRLPIPFVKALLFRTKAPRGNPEGRSWLRNAYTSYYLCKLTRAYEGIGVERDLAGLPKMEVPLALFDADKSGQLEVYKNLVRKVRMDEYAGLVVPTELDGQGNPTGYKFSLVQSGGRRPQDVNEIVKRYESRMLMALLAEFIMLGMDKIGSYSLSSDKTGLFAMAIGRLLDGIDDTYNRYAIKRLCDYNGVPLELRPRRAHGDIEREDIQAFATGLSALVGSGALVTSTEDEENIRERFGMPQRVERADRSRDDQDVERLGMAALAQAARDQTEQQDQSAAPVDAAPPASVLNGAQVQSIQQLLEAVTDGSLPAQSVKELLVSVFAIPSDRADAIVDPIVVRPPAPPVAPLPPGVPR